MSALAEAAAAPRLVAAGDLSLDRLPEGPQRARWCRGLTRQGVRDARVMMRRAGPWCQRRTLDALLDRTRLADLNVVRGLRRVSSGERSLAVGRKALSTVRGAGYRCEADGGTPGSRGGGGRRMRERLRWPPSRAGDGPWTLAAVLGSALERVDYPDLTLGRQGRGGGWRRYSTKRIATGNGAVAPGTLTIPVLDATGRITIHLACLNGSADARRGPGAGRQRGQAGPGRWRARSWGWPSMRGGWPSARPGIHVLPILDLLHQGPAKAWHPLPGLAIGSRAFDMMALVTVAPRVQVRPMQRCAGGAAEVTQTCVAA